MAKKSKGPKKIAGVKVPKTVRKSAITTLFESELGRQILADALIAAAGAAAAALVKNRPSAQQVAHAGGAVVDAGADAAAATRDTVHSAAGGVAHLVTEAAQHILPSGMTGVSDRDENDGRPGKKTFAHLADQERKGKRDKNRSKTSKH